MRFQLVVDADFLPRHLRRLYGILGHFHGYWWGFRLCFVGYRIHGELPPYFLWPHLSPAPHSFTGGPGLFHICAYRRNPIVSSLPAEERPSGNRILTIQIFCQVLWVGGGIVGALAGRVIPSSVQGMEFALVALFVVLAMDSFRSNQDFSLPLSAVVVGILAAVFAPGQLLMVGLSAYFILLIIRYASPRIDAAIGLRSRGESTRFREER